MKRFALAVVLSVFVTHFAAAQHHAEGGSSSSSSSSGSSGGSSSGGGYSGGSSSGASHSSGGGGYSGGSHSSGGSGNSGGYSGGGSSHSGGSSSSAGGGNSHSRGNSSVRSDMRSRTNSVEHLGSVTNPTGGIHGGGNVVSGHSTAAQGANAYSMLRKTTASGEPWMNKPYTLDISAANLSRALSHHEFDSKLQAEGLESNKSAYRDRLAALGIKAPEVHRLNWIARMFGAKAMPDKESASPQLRPCLAKECKPIPVPPKPCAGEKCPAPPRVPVPTPVTGVCANGYDSNGYCLPWGYVSRCSTYGNYCYVRFARVNPNYCVRILQQIRREQANYRQVEQQQQSACATQSQECTQATQKLQKLGKGIIQLQQQYQLCQTATGWATADPAWSTGTVAAPEWPSDAWPYFPPFF